MLEFNHFLGPLFLFIFLLLVRHLQLFVAHAPKLSEVLLLLFIGCLLFLFALNLQLARAIDCLGHFVFAALLIFKNAVRLVLCLGHLLVQDLFLVVTKGAQVLNLSIDESLAGCQLVLDLGILAVLLLLVEGFFLTSESLNTLLLLKFLLFHELLEFDLFLVGLADVLSHLLHLLFALEFPDFFTFNVLFDLALDELTLEHLLLKLLNVVKFELFQLV